jgi:hypothetical protein
MGMGHRLKESQTDLFPFKGPTDAYEAGSGKILQGGVIIYN